MDSQGKYVERRGGKRAGAGRKPITQDPNDPLLTYSVRIFASQAKLLKLWGNGNVSAGLRWLVDVAAKMVTKAERMVSSSQEQV